MGNKDFQRGKQRQKRAAGWAEKSYLFYDSNFLYFMKYICPVFYILSCILQGIFFLNVEMSVLI